MQTDYSPITSAVFSRMIDALPYIIGILAFIFALNFLEGKFGNKRRGRWRGRGRSDWQSRGGKSARFQPKHDFPAKVPDAADQLRTVMLADFKAQPLLNKSEARLFKAIDKIVLEMRPDWQVMAQVSLGEILRCDDAEAYRCINSKRVDLLIVDEECKPRHAIEYQGGAHYKGAHATAARDAVKKEALRRAGIGYEEVRFGEVTGVELRRMLERLVRVQAGRP